ncbi:hypothetical protein C2G38_2319445 [Gigaspora rosea]|uniref:CCHC-type domain-containing protein n=1 Tax=Gigaspora rosea TaxID=44941 RepID=A0A397V854_9GLOM|nr:hypothetical protein C2G38_2319445 [Gigaspora rosea]
MDNSVYHEKGMLDAELCSKIILPLRKMATMPTTTTPAVKKTIHKRNQYSQIWGLAQQNFLANQEQSRITNQTCELSTSNQNIKEESEDKLYLSKIEEIEEFETIMTNSNTLNLTNIQNPLHVVSKGRPSNRRYVSSDEKEQKHSGTSIYKSYKCRICGQLGHNAAFHKKKTRGKRDKNLSNVKSTYRIYQIQE